MITAAMREAAYQALVKLGVPIPPEEIDAVLEAAEGARGTTTPQEKIDQYVIRVLRTGGNGWPAKNQAAVYAEATLLALAELTEAVRELTVLTQYPMRRVEPPYRQERA